MPYKPPSLRAQAVALLAQREHSEIELRRKLLRRLRRDVGVDADSSLASPAAQIDEVLIWLRERGYLDEARFVDSRVHARAGRFGPARIEQELSRHGLALPAEVAQTLRATELEQATQLWQRKFGQPAADAREAARQARFLAGRGFSGEVIQQILRAARRGRDNEAEGH